MCFIPSIYLLSRIHKKINYYFYDDFIEFYPSYSCKLIVVKILHGLLVIVLIRGRVSTWVTNGNKTAVMDVIGFLCVALGSSTVQLRGRE
jgi:hypothetical protein